MTNQLAQLKQQIEPNPNEIGDDHLLAFLKHRIEAHHWTWRSECNDPGEAQLYAHGKRYTFRIYAGVHVRIANGTSELEAAQQAWEEIQQALARGDSE